MLLPVADTNGGGVDDGAPDSEGMDAMIRHVVLVRAREGVAPSEIPSIFAALAALRPQLSGMVNFACGVDVSPEGLARGHTHAFTIDFVDAAARDAYLALPDHEAAGARLVKAAEGGLSGLTVFDFAPAERI